MQASSPFSQNNTIFLHQSAWRIHVPRIKWNTTRELIFVWSIDAGSAKKKNRDPKQKVREKKEKQSESEEGKAISSQNFLICVSAHWSRFVDNPA